MPDFPPAGGATAAEVWAYGTRKLTGFDGQPRIDLVGQDASLEATTGARISRIDRIPAYEGVTETSVTMNGTEQTLVEIIDTKSGEIEVWIDLSPMAAGDTIVIRYYKKVKSGGSYAKYYEQSYFGAQDLPALCILSKKSYRDTRVSAQQTSGTYRTIDLQVIRLMER